MGYILDTLIFFSLRHFNFENLEIYVNKNNNFIFSYMKKKFKKVREKQVYTKLDDSTKIKLITLLKKDKIKIREASKILNINYNTAKTIWRNYRLEQGPKKIKIFSENENQREALNNLNTLTQKNDIQKIENSNKSEGFLEDEIPSLSTLNETDKGVLLKEFSTNMNFINLINQRDKLLNEVHNNNEIITFFLIIHNCLYECYGKNNSPKT